jgi:putative ABC transport system permease protein
VSPMMARGIFLVAKTDASANNDIVKRIANAVMQHRHNGVDDYEIWDFSGVMGQFAQIFLILKLIVGFVASISLLVGGVGVMNMMFVSVSERTKEIGIRKALGASPRAIELQFLFEAMFLSSIGGFLGVSLGVLGALGANVGIAKLEEAWVGTVSVPAVIIALVVSLAVGIGFGFVPAKRAATLDAVDAMRR